MLIKINNEEALNYIKGLLNDSGVEIEIYKNAYEAEAYEEAEASIDYAIEKNDVFITPQQYDDCLEETAKRIYDSDEDIMQELTYLGYDLAVEVMEEKQILVD